MPISKQASCRDEIASLCVALLEEPSALNSTFEIKSLIPFSEPFSPTEAQRQQQRDWSSLLRNAKLSTSITGKLETDMSPEENEALTSAAI